MPYKGRAPLTISTIQPCCPGLVIESITKEEPIFAGGTSPGYRSGPSDVVVATLCVKDARGNALNLVSKRSKQVASRPTSAIEKSNDVSERMNEANFYLHYSDYYHGLLRRVTTGLQRTRKHRTIVHGDFVSSNLAFFPSSIPDAYSTCAAFDFKKAGRGYGVYDLAVLLCESVDQGLLVRDMREEEFLGIYFQHLGSCLRARKKPPLPPGYNIQDATSTYEVCLMLYCAAVASKGKGAEGEGGGYEYAIWRCRQLVEGLEREGGKGGGELSESAWGNILMAKYPIR
ncbi:hypothetical protein TrRE_jg8815 [Triparma retinervis]|uniref:Uncharacterized protein n=1 Tax=Triparma retinervis TaxID=2557542 RepID=A0A9W7KV39_9STRA|nr:hypothetical protein TrRE_jg8815 [Triparma retinervis]